VLTTPGSAALLRVRAFVNGAALVTSALLGGVVIDRTPPIRVNVTLPDHGDVGDRGIPHQMIGCAFGHTSMSEESPHDRTSTIGKSRPTMYPLI
jgi:hypothetical protein